MLRTLLAMAVAMLLPVAGANAAAPASTAAPSSTATDAGTPPAGTLPAADQLSPEIFPPDSYDKPPPFFSASARDAIRSSERTKAVQKARAEHPDIKPRAYISPLRLDSGTFYHWEVYYYHHGQALVEVDLDRGAHVLEIQKAPDVGWGIVRGYGGILGGRLNAPYLWLPLCVLFVLPFVDPRRLRRLIHLDLAVLVAGFGVSQYYFTRGEPDTSVPLAYLPLFYVLGRALFAGFAPRVRRGPLVPYMSTRTLAVVAVVLLVLRGTFALADTQALDIGVAGVVGADRVEHGLELYTDNDYHGDTYGPVNYLMYVPFELLNPYVPGEKIDPTARLATFSFDALTVVGLFLLGRRLRRGRQGTRLGVVLAYAWAAFPYTALVLASNTNDALVPLFIVYALLALSSAPARGAFGALAAMAKFAPGAVAPLLIAGRERLRLRTALVAGGVFALICVGLIAFFLPDGGVREFWNTTLGFQLSRTSPLSIWIRRPGLDFLRPVFLALAVILIVAVAFVPRRRTTGQVAALAAAVLAAIQVPANYWLYFYVVWFAPFLLLALFEEHRELGPGQDSVTSSFVNPVRMSQPSSVTATRSSMRTPTLPGT